mgnify:CR=1 FL=1
MRHPTYQLSVACLRRSAVLCAVGVLGIGTTLLSGCTAPSHFMDFYEGQTAMLVVNHTTTPIQIAYAPAESQRDKPGAAITKMLVPDESIRLTGHKGDQLTIDAGQGNPFVVNYGSRSQVVDIVLDAGSVVYHLRRGYNDTK